jgi:STE24 endopeptidase
VNVTKASRYHQLRRRADLLGTVVTGAVLLLIAVSGAAVVLRESVFMVTGALPGAWADVAAAILLAAVLTVILTLVGLPFAYYQGYFLEHRYGLSTETPQRWRTDQVKSAILGLLLAMGGGGAVYATMAWSPNWWWLLSAMLAAGFLVVLVALAPVVVLPLFYTFKPLDRPALVSRLLALAGRAGADVVGVFEWSLSAHTKKANAALTGLGRTRRILLSDTLLADYSDDEIEVVLAHELAHHVHRDLWRGMLLHTALMFGGFFVASLVLSGLAVPLGLRGVDDPAGLPILWLVAGAWSFVSLPIVNALSRAHERRADRYAVETTKNPGAFVSAMKRLGQQNLAEEEPSAAVQWLFYSHPPIRDRIAAVKAQITAR